MTSIDKLRLHASHNRWSMPCPYKTTNPNEWTTDPTPPMKYHAPPRLNRFRWETNRVRDLALQNIAYHPSFPILSSAREYHVPVNQRDLLVWRSRAVRTTIDESHFYKIFSSMFGIRVSKYVPELDVYDHDVETGPDYYCEADDSGHRKDNIYDSCSWGARMDRLK